MEVAGPEAACAAGDGSGTAAGSDADSKEAGCPVAAVAGAEGSTVAARTDANLKAGVTDAAGADALEQATCKSALPHSAADGEVTVEVDKAPDFNFGAIVSFIRCTPNLHLGKTGVRLVT